MSELPGTASELGNWRDLEPDERDQFFQQLWISAIALSDRYRLALRSGWWEDQVQLEALAAFAAWVELYDTTTYTDPPGKLQLLWALEPLRAVLRSGQTAFEPRRDRPAFEHYLATLEANPDEAAPGTPPADARSRQRQLETEHAALSERRAELEHRRHALEQALDRDRDTAGHATAELAELHRSINQLQTEEAELRRALGHARDG
jgi:hypothetical protein